MSTIHARANKDGLGQQERREQFANALMRDNRLSAHQKRRLEDMLISDGMTIPSEFDSNYSSRQAFDRSHLSESAGEKYDEFITGAGINFSAADFANIYDFKTSARSDKDASGNTTVSAQDKVSAEINKLKVSREVKNAIWLAVGYSYNTMWRAPWN